MHVRWIVLRKRSLHNPSVTLMDIPIYRLYDQTQHKNMNVGHSHHAKRDYKIIHIYVDFYFSTNIVLLLLQSVLNQTYTNSLTLFVYQTVLPVGSGRL